MLFQLYFYNFVNMKNNFKIYKFGAIIENYTFYIILKNYLYFHFINLILKA